MGVILLVFIAGALASVLAAGILHLFSKFVIPRLVGCVVWLQYRSVAAAQFGLVATQPDLPTSLYDINLKEFEASMDALRHQVDLSYRTGLGGKLSPPTQSISAKMLDDIVLQADEFGNLHARDFIFVSASKSTRITGSARPWLAEAKLTSAFQSQHGAGRVRSMRLSELIRTTVVAPT